MIVKWVLILSKEICFEPYEEVELANGEIWGNQVLFFVQIADSEEISGESPSGHLATTGVFSQIQLNSFNRIWPKKCFFDGDRIQNARERKIQHDEIHLCAKEVKRSGCTWLLVTSQRWQGPCRGTSSWSSPPRPSSSRRGAPPCTASGQVSNCVMEKIAKIHILWAFKTQHFKVRQVEWKLLSVNTCHFMVLALGGFWLASLWECWLAAGAGLGKC